MRSRPSAGAVAREWVNGRGFGDGALEMAVYHFVYLDSAKYHEGPLAGILTKKEPADVGE